MYEHYLHTFDRPPLTKMKRKNLDSSNFQRTYEEKATNKEYARLFLSLKFQLWY